MSIEFLKFKRKLCESMGNKAALMSIPRVIANMWSEYDEVEFTFYGDYILVKPVMPEPENSLGCVDPDSEENRRASVEIMDIGDRNDK